MSFLLPIIAIIPGLLIAFLIYKLDKYDKEPVKHLIISFILGLLCTFPALKLEEFGSNAGLDRTDHFGILILFSFGIVALSEELVKFLALMLYAYPKKIFDEPLDGIVYSVMISMGFATIENIFYAWRYGLETTLVRAFTAVPAHGVFAVIMGYFVGLAKFNPSRKNQLLFLGLLGAVLVHGTYDFFIIQEYYEWLILFATVTLFIGIYLAYQLIVLHQQNSPHKEKDSV